MPNNLVYRAPHPPPGVPYNEKAYGNFATFAKPSASVDPIVDRFVDISNLVGRTVQQVDRWLEAALTPRPRIIGTWLRGQGIAVQRGDALDLATHALLVGFIGSLAVSVACGMTSIPEPTAVILAVTCMMFYHAVAVDGCLNP